jgi:hypothetical protein
MGAIRFSSQIITKNTPLQVCTMNVSMKLRRNKCLCQPLPSFIEGSFDYSEIPGALVLQQIIGVSKGNANQDDLLPYQRLQSPEAFRGSSIKTPISSWENAP